MAELWPNKQNLQNMFLMNTINKRLLQQYIK